MSELCKNGIGKVVFSEIAYDMHVGNRTWDIRIQWANVTYIIIRYKLVHWKKINRSFHHRSQSHSYQQLLVIEQMFSFIILANIRSYFKLKFTIKFHKLRNECIYLKFCVEIILLSKRDIGHKGKRELRISVEGTE
jgi:hypothetical protein